MSTDSGGERPSPGGLAILLVAAGVGAILAGLFGVLAAVVVSSCCGSGPGEQGPDAAMLTFSCIVVVCGTAMLVAARILPRPGGRHRAARLGTHLWLLVGVFVSAQQFLGFGVRRTSFGMIGGLVLLLGGAAPAWHYRRRPNIGPIVDRQ